MSTYIMNSKYNQIKIKIKIKKIKKIINNHSQELLNNPQLK